jgi:hypothetical protein
MFQDLAKYRPAVINMCSVFEHGLADFIKSLGSADDKGSPTKLAIAGVSEGRGKLKRKRNTCTAKELPKILKTQEEGNSEVHTECQSGPVIVEGTRAPVETTTAPVEKTTAPVERTTASVATTTTPVETKDSPK